MTAADQTQYNRFLAAGYSPEMAEKLVARGAWLGEAGRLTVDDAEAVRQYREERDASTG